LKDKVSFALTFAALLMSLSTARANDSREVSAERRKFYAETSFYCNIGRTPLKSSADAWTIHSPDSCAFSGPLDTKLNPLKLEPPILNPTLTIDELVAFISAFGLSFQRLQTDELRFQLPTGQWLTATTVPSRDMVDKLFHFGSYPTAWGNSFVSITAADSKSIRAFITLSNSHGSPIFWENPHLLDEQNVISRLQGPRNYMPLELLSRCSPGNAWRDFGGQRSLLLVGDMHSGAETLFLLSMIKEKPFAWVGLEMTRDRESLLNAFLAANEPSSEEEKLTALLSRSPKNVVDAAKSLMRELKALKTKIVLIDYEEKYFNFPYTSTAFHGLIVAARNLMWVNRLPKTWSGVGVILGGLDHFTVTPAADFQDFASERFPNLDMALINPLEKCSVEISDAPDEKIK
jgi:hypothetical protein